MEMLKKWLQENPDDAFLNYAMALELLAADAPDEALILLLSLHEKDPTYLPAYYQLGKLHEYKGEKEEAISIYRSGIKVAQEQSDGKTKGELAEALFMLED